MGIYNDKSKIIEHYDLVSPYYHSLWGKHLHHGYWVTGQETKEEAQLALTKHLALNANIKAGDRILDIGCGFGASSIYLAQNYNAKTTGITISPVQVEMAREAAHLGGVDSEFILMDAEAITLTEPFDVLWSIESISHYKDKVHFFDNAIKLLKPGGTIAVIDWFKKDNLSPAEEEKYIKPIEEGMLVELHAMNDYTAMLRANNLTVAKTEDISTNVARTWDISLNIIKDPALWKLALTNSKEILNFLNSFRAMRAGFTSGNFIYGLIIAKRV